MRSIEARVRKVIAEERDLEESEVGIAATLKKDLGFDKMEVEFMLRRVEDEFAVELDEKAASKARSVQDVIDYVKKGLEAKIKSVIAECAGVAESSVTGRKTMKALEVEPDEVADLMTNLGVDFRIHIPLQEAQSIVTVQQAIDAVITRLESGSSESALEETLARLEQLINEPLIRNRIEDLESLSTHIEEVRNSGPEAVPRQTFSELLQRIALYESWAQAYASDSPAYAAAREGDATKVIQFVDAGLDVDAPGSDGRTLLMLAAANGHAAAVERLIARGADCAAACELEGGLDAMYMACRNAHVDVVRVLLDHGADVNKRYPNTDTHAWHNKTALSEAAQLGYLNLCRLLIERGADLEAVSYSARTPLMWAMGGDGAAAELLLDAGANPDPKAKATKGAKVFPGFMGEMMRRAYASSETTPLILAVEAGLPKVAHRLIEAKVALDATNRWGKTALHRACESNQAACASHLIRAGANLDASDNDGLTPLICAARNGSWESMQLLLEGGAAVNQSAHQGGTALREVISRLLNEEGGPSQREAAFNFTRKLLEAGANPDVAYEDDGDNKLIDEAQDQGDEELHELLGEYGAKLRDRSADEAKEGSEDEAGEEEPMDLAGILSKMQQSIASLNRALSQVTGRDPSDGDRLVIAASQSNVERVTEILESGVDVNHLDGDGDTALGICVIKLCTEELEQQDVRDFFEIIDLLLQHGAKVDVQGCRIAALPMVSRAGSLALTNAFLRAGADPHAVLTEIDQDAGKTALEVAREGKHDEVVAALMAAQA